MARQARIALALGLAAGIFTTGAFSATTVDGAAIGNEQDASNWLSYGRTYSEQRFSPLKEINDGNVGNLGVAWYLDLPGQKSLLATPLVVDGIMYFSGGYSVVFAIDTRKMDYVGTRHDPVSLIAKVGVGTTTDLTMANGRILWQNGTFPGLDEGKLFAQAEAALHRTLT